MFATTDLVLVGPVTGAPPTAEQCHRLKVSKHNAIALWRRLGGRLRWCSGAEERESCFAISVRRCKKTGFDQIA